MNVRTHRLAGWAMVLAIAGAIGPAVAVAQNSPAAPAPASRGLTAIEEAARNNRYLFLFFWRDNERASQEAYRVFQAATRKWTQSADAVSICVSDPAEAPVVGKFGVERAPMPMVLALAPNGAVTKGAAAPFTEQDLAQAFVTPCSARLLKALQDRKLVVLCVAGRETQSAQAAWEGAQQFKADARFANATEVVALDPADASEAGLLQSLQVDARTTQAVTLVLAPPGQPIARFAGAVTKDQIAAKVASAQSGCCPGGKCGPGGCGPKR